MHAVSDVYSFLNLKENFKGVLRIRSEFFSRALSEEWLTPKHGQDGATSSNTAKCSAVAETGKNMRT